MAILKDDLTPEKSSSETTPDFGDGGAFPERLYPQYPLGMGKNTPDPKPGQNSISLSIDENGNLTYHDNAIVNQNENKIVYSQHTNLVRESNEKLIEETTLQTKTQFEKILNRAFSTKPSDPKFIKYMPSQESLEFNSGAKERIISMVEKPMDPLEPGKFKHEKFPKGSGDPPVPVLHSPPRVLSVEDQQGWKIPPIVSNWKNPKGYTIPLEKRVGVDGRGLEEVKINDGFAKLYESLCVVEQKAREEVTMRGKIEKEKVMMEKERKEMELRALAQKARSEKTYVAPSVSSGMNVMNDGDIKKERGKIREERRRERDRERRLEAKEAAMGKKRMVNRDGDRDMSEKVALGMAYTGYVMHDQRLFNQEKGMDSGFATDDRYNVYDKGLFTAQPTLSTLYRMKKDMDGDVYGGGDEQLEKILKTDRFKPDKGFAGTKETGLGDRPVEFEEEDEEADPFGLDQFLTNMTKGKEDMDDGPPQ